MSSCKMLIHFVYQLFFLFSFSIFPSQIIAKLPPKFIEFEHISTKDGLSNDTVYDIIQDSQGFMWFATANGLSKYNGYDFKIYRSDPDNPASVKGSIFLRFLMDSRNILWVASVDGGLHRYEALRDRFITYEHDPNDPTSISSNRIYSIAEDHQGNLWITTLDAGLNKLDYDTGKFVRYQHNPDNPHSIISNRLTGVFVDRQGGVWIAAADKGLEKYDILNDQFIHYSHSLNNPHWPDFSPLNMSQASNGDLLITSIGQGFFRYNMENGSLTNYKHDSQKTESLAFNQTIFSFIDSQDTIWITTWGGGLDVYDPEKDLFLHYQHDSNNPKTLKHNSTWSIYEDRSGVIWVGTYGAGISKYDRKKERFGKMKHNPTVKNSLSFDQVKSIFKDSQGDLWIGTLNPGGLNRYDESTKTFTHYYHDPNDSNSLSSNEVWSIAEDKNQDLWIATTGGLNRYERRTNRFFRYNHSPDDPDSLSSDIIRSVYVDKHGELWIGHQITGADRYDPATQKFVNYPTGHPASYILYRDKKNKLYLGNAIGLFRYDSETQKFTPRFLDANNPEALDTIIAIYEDPLGNLWLGTNKGLKSIDATTGDVSHYSTQNGLINNEVTGILDGGNGKLWISTTKGLSEFDPQTNHTRNYKVDSFIKTAYFKSGEGELFFGGSQGLTHFYPEAIVDNVTPPPIVLTDFKKFNKSVVLEQPIFQLQTLHLNYSDRVISFEFAALDYSNPSENRYKYKLEGIDPDWVEVGADRRFATYTNLNGGDYTFKVIGSNSDGIWNNVGAVLHLAVSPPPWRTWWAYSAYLLLVFAIILGYVRFQTKKLEKEYQINERLREMDRLKDDFLANTSHELRTPLNGIIGIAESLMDGVTGNLPEPTRRNLAMVVSSGRRLSHLVNDILDFSKMRHKDLKLQKNAVDMYSVAEVILVLSQPLIGQKDIQLINQIPSTAPHVSADEGRVEQILHNLVANAIKFTETGTVTLSASSPQESFLTIRVSDTGIGIPKEKFNNIFESFEQADGSIEREYGGSGLGLAITKQLVTLHGGRIWVKSKMGQGSQFYFTLPISQETVISSNNSDLLKKNLRISQLVAPPSGDLIEQTITPLAPTVGEQAYHSILIVDDEPINLQVLRNHLSLQHYQVTTAMRGQEALNLLSSNPSFDLVLLDIMMPGMSGIEVCQKTREHYKTDELPIILVTAKNRVEDLMAGLKAGGNDYLPKPFSKDELLARIELHLSLKNLADQRKKNEIELRKHRDHLEDMVAERTEELKISRDKERKARDKAEAANRAKSDFLAHMSHEIRTPMNAILGFAEIMKSKIIEPQLIHYLSSIYSSGKSLLRLINDILDLSKVESGKLELEYTVLSPRNLFEEMETVFGQSVREKGLELLIDIDPNLPKALFLDETRLRQILVNLIGNAIKFTEEGYIKLSAQFQVLQDMPANRINFIFSVEDTGKGIPKDQQASIFQAFSQVTGQSFNQYGGTGLGLTITQRLIEMMRGTIGVISTLGKGTIFQITLQEVEVPTLDDIEIHASEDYGTESVLFQPATILVADDIEFNRELIKGFLDHHDLQILEAATGREALEKIKQSRPDLILMDMKMPEMNGLEAISILKKDPIWKSIPIITVTASAMKEEEELLKTLSDGYLIKPITKKSLLSELMKFLSHTLEDTISITASIEAMSAAAIASLPSVIEILDKEVTPVWKTLQTKQPMKKVMQFGKQTKELGKTYEVTLLQNYGEQIIMAVNEFDVSGIRGALEQFPKLKEQLRSLVSQPPPH